MRKPTLTIMIGLPGSGKSFVANKLSGETGAKVFSSDHYRFLINGDESDQSNVQEVFKALYRDLREHLLSCKDAIFDATNCTMKDRRRIFNQLNGIDYYKTAYIVNTPFEKCVVRDNLRDRVVGISVIDKYYKKFQCPQYFEGFDEILINNTKNDNVSNFLIDCIQDKMKDFDQQNPHHLFTLGEHCRKLAENYTDFRYTAGLYHDLGKLFTQTFDDDGIAHYYSHDSVGAYEMISHIGALLRDYSTDEALKIICFINYHMNFHKQWRIEKYKNLMGEELYNIMIEFAENDKRASGTYERRINNGIL